MKGGKVLENKNESRHSCAELERFASYADKYISDELTEKEISELFEHAEKCPECRRYLEITVKTDEAVDVPDMASMPRGLHAKIMESVKTDAAKVRVREQQIPKVSRFVPFAAAFLCIFLIAALFITTPESLTDGGKTDKNAVTADALMNGAEDALTNGSPLSPEPNESVPALTPNPDEPTAASTNAEAAPETAVSPENSSNAELTSAASPDTSSPSVTHLKTPLFESGSITFIVFGLCAIFAFSSVISLIVFIFAAKKKQ
jgi:hypothetical protein